MSLIVKLKKRIEDYRAFLVRDDPFNRDLLSGKGSIDAIACFLVDVHHLAQHTPIRLKLAIKASAGHPLLQSYLKNKFLKEQGHDQRALDDLAHLSRSNSIGKSSVSPEMSAFVGHIECLIREDPYLYRPYIFFAEYLVVIYGPEMTRGMEASSFGSGSLTVIENHSDLDKDHVDESEQILTRLVVETTYEGKFLAVIDETIRLHKKFGLSCQGVCHEAA